MAVLLDEIHPGEILLEDFLKPMGITARQLAADIDVSPSRISDLVHGNRPITADTALRLGHVLQHGPAFLAQPADGVRHARGRQDLAGADRPQDPGFPGEGRGLTGFISTGLSSPACGLVRPVSIEG